MRHTAFVLASILVLPSCDYGALGGPDSTIGVDDVSLVRLQPAATPWTMKVGERVRFEATFVNEAAETGYVVWATNDPAVVRWDPTDPPCRNDRCRLLVAVGPGTTRVRIETCVGLPTWGCSTQDARIDVCPDPNTSCDPYRLGVSTARTGPD